jgi:hypothetical protein
MTHPLFSSHITLGQFWKSTGSASVRFRGAERGLITKAFQALLVTAGILKLTATALALSSVTVGWNANPETDIEGYKVYFGTASGNYTEVQDVTGGTTTVLSGLNEGATYYCAIQAYNVGGMSSELSSEISFVAGVSVVDFETWASTGGLSGSLALPSATPFNDGVPNLLKYAFNMNSTGPDVQTLTVGSGTEGLPVFSLDTTGAQPKFRVEYLRRIGSGLSYAPKSSTDLVNFQSMSGATSVTAIDSNWERVVVETDVDLTASPKMFGMVEVTMP